MRTGRGGLGALADGVVGVHGGIDIAGVADMTNLVLDLLRVGTADGFQVRRVFLGAEGQGQSWNEDGMDYERQILDGGKKACWRSSDSDLGRSGEENEKSSWFGEHFGRLIGFVVEWVSKTR